MCSQLKSDDAIKLIFIARIKSLEIQVIYIQTKCKVAHLYRLKRIGIANKIRLFCKILNDYYTDRRYPVFRKDIRAISLLSFFIYLFYFLNFSEITKKVEESVKWFTCDAVTKRN